MKCENHSGWAKLIFPVVLIVSLGCSLFQNPKTIIQTPTLTPDGGGMPVATKQNPDSRCNGNSGSLEMQVLAGPAKAVGLEPFAVGNIPFSITKNGQIYAIQGTGDISYHQILEESWGTYTVTLDMSADVSGECIGDSGNEILDMTVEVSGDQLVEVRSEGFSGDYPWSGTHQLKLNLPLVEGASAEGEGWAFILHLYE